MKAVCNRGAARGILTKIKLISLKMVLGFFLHFPHLSIVDVFFIILQQHLFIMIKYYYF